jgi:hypothetical protein
MGVILATILVSMIRLITYLVRKYTKEKHKKVKILYEDQIIDGVIEQDGSFIGGEKVIYVNKDGTTCIIAKELVTIYEYENT